MYAKNHIPGWKPAKSHLPKNKKDRKGFGRHLIRRQTIICKVAYEVPIRDAEGNLCWYEVKKKRKKIRKLMTETHYNYYTRTINHYA